MTTVTFPVTMTMDLEEWKDHCWGSGWTMWEWWAGADATDEGVIAEWYEDCDDPDSEIHSGFLTYQEIANVAAAVAEWHPEVNRQLQASDFDAVYMDVVMQQAFLGEVIYG